MCRSRRELSQGYLLANIGVDTAENEPSEVLKFGFRPTTDRRPCSKPVSRNAASSGSAASSRYGGEFFSENGLGLELVQ